MDKKKSTYENLYKEVFDDAKIYLTTHLPKILIIDIISILLFLILFDFSELSFNGFLLLDILLGLASLLIGVNFGFVFWNQTFGRYCECSYDIHTSGGVAISSKLWYHVTISSVIWDNIVNYKLNIIVLIGLISNISPIYIPIFPYLIGSLIGNYYNGLRIIKIDSRKLYLGHVVP